MVKPPASICSDVAVAELTRPIFRRWKWEQECFVVLLLDNKNKPIGRPLVIAVGTANAVAVHPRDVFREAVRRNACALVIAHCHPSGDTTPSEDDLALTEQIKQAAALLGIRFLDHVIVARRALYSLAAEGRI